MLDTERIEAQRLFFGKQNPLSLKYRKKALKRLQKTIIHYETDIAQALEADLRKSAYESYLTEIGFVRSELRQAIAQLKKWATTQAGTHPFPPHRERQACITYQGLRQRTDSRSLELPVPTTLCPSHRSCRSGELRYVERVALRPAHQRNMPEDCRRSV